MTYKSSDLVHINRTLASGEYICEVCHPKWFAQIKSEEFLIEEINDGLSKFGFEVGITASSIGEATYFYARPQGVILDINDTEEEEVDMMRKYCADVAKNFPAMESYIEMIEVAKGGVSIMPYVGYQFYESDIVNQVSSENEALINIMNQMITLPLFKDSRRQKIKGIKEHFDVFTRTMVKLGYLNKEPNGISYKMTGKYVHHMKICELIIERQAEMEGFVVEESQMGLGI